jgi:hypothetical protein
LNLSESAVAVRLHRGKLALRRILDAEMKPDANGAGWLETRIWCPQCGRQRLLGQLSNDELVLRCTNCCTDPTWMFMHHVDRSGKLAGIKHFKPALARVMKWGNVYYHQGLKDGTVRCMACGASVPLRIGNPPFMPARSEPGVYAICECDATRPEPRNHSSLWGLANFLPEVQDFWRRNPRMRMVPHYGVEAAGRAAVVFTFESITTAAQISVIYARDNFDLLGIHGADHNNLEHTALSIHGTLTK